MSDGAAHVKRIKARKWISVAVLSVNTAAPHLPRNLTMPDSASAVPAPRFAATGTFFNQDMEPKGDIFGKSSGQ